MAKRFFYLETMAKQSVRTLLDAMAVSGDKKPVLTKLAKEKGMPVSCICAASFIIESLPPDATELALGGKLYCRPRHNRIIEQYAELTGKTVDEVIKSLGPRYRKQGGPRMRMGAVAAGKLMDYLGKHTSKEEVDASANVSDMASTLLMGAREASGHPIQHRSMVRALRVLGTRYEQDVRDGRLSVFRAHVLLGHESDPWRKQAAAQATGAPETRETAPTGAPEAPAGTQTPPAAAKTAVGQETQPKPDPETHTMQLEVRATDPAHEAKVYAKHATDLRAWLSLGSELLKRIETDLATYRFKSRQ